MSRLPVRQYTMTKGEGEQWAVDLGGRQGPLILRWYSFSPPRIDVIRVGLARFALEHILFANGVWIMADPMEVLRGFGMGFSSNQMDPNKNEYVVKFQEETTGLDRGQVVYKAIQFWLSMANTLALAVFSARQHGDTLPPLPASLQPFVDALGGPPPTS